MAKMKRRSAGAAVCAAASLVVAMLASPIIQAPVAHAAPQTYTYTGSPQLYVVPPGVTSIQVTLTGAGGLSVTNGGVGGQGGVVTATVAVQPGELLMFNVGGQGVTNAGAFNGGGRPGGGGATDIRRPTPSTPLTTSSSCAYDFNCGLGEQIVVAGGGGGGGNTPGSDGGSGGSSGTGGVAGNQAGGDATGGAGATQGAGGAAGTGSVTGPGQSAAPGVGARGTGGANGWAVGAFGGGGGGGYFGGGQGGQSTNGIGGNIGAGGGGGGSSWAGGSGVTGATFQTGGNSGNGSLTVDPPSAIQGAAFGFTGSAQTYTVPAGVSQLSVRITGGGSAAQGDTVYGRLPVTPAQVVQVNIGSAATPVSSFNGAFSGGSGGWNGGGNSSQTSIVGALGVAVPATSESRPTPWMIESSSQAGAEVATASGVRATAGTSARAARRSPVLAARRSAIAGTPGTEEVPSLAEVHGSCHPVAPAEMTRPRPWPPWASSAWADQVTLAVAGATGAAPVVRQAEAARPTPRSQDLTPLAKELATSWAQQARHSSTTAGVAAEMASLSSLPCRSV